MIDPVKLTEDFHSLAQKQFSPHTYSHWIKGLDISISQPQSSERTLIIHLLVEDTHTHLVIESRYLDTIKSIFSILLDGYNTLIEFNPIQGSLDINLTPIHTHPEGVARESDDLFFSDHYTFENFILGSSNQFAHAAAKAIAEDPGKCFNPLFIFGASGLGKTHLIRALGYEIRKKKPAALVRYITCDNFINDFTHLSRKNALHLFRKKYREDCEVLLLDDIQFLSGKEGIQEEFFYTFNALYESSKQIVITSDKVPKNLTGLETRIRTRFEWGLIADIQPPDLETRIEILKDKMNLFDLKLEQNVIHFLASHCTQNIRELEGVLNKLKAIKTLSHGKLDLESVRTQIKGHFEGEKNKVQTHHILQAVAHEFGCRVMELKSSIKARDIALPRHISMYLIRKYTEKSYPEIGEAVGGKDHATVMHGVRKINRLLYEDQNLRTQIELIEERIKSTASL